MKHGKNEYFSNFVLHLESQNRDLNADLDREKGVASKVDSVKNDVDIDHQIGHRIDNQIDQQNDNQTDNTNTVDGEQQNQSQSFADILLQSGHEEHDFLKFSTLAVQSKAPILTVYIGDTFHNFVDGMI